VRTAVYPLLGVFREIDELLRPFLLLFGRSDYEEYVLKETGVLAEAIKAYIDQQARTYITLNQTEIVSGIPLRCSALEQTERSHRP
jgi:hypothetical protein